MSSYSLHQSLLNIAADFQYAFDHGDLSMARSVIDGDLATAYVFAKELETHGYEAFKALVYQYNQGKEVEVDDDFDMEDAE